MSVGLIIALSAAGCASADTDWEEAQSPSGTYVAEFPAEVQTSTQAVPEFDAEQAFTVAELENSAYVIGELPLPPDMPFDLDASVEGNVAGVLADLEAQFGESGEATEVSRDTGEFEGAETREIVADFEIGDESAQTRAKVFVRDDVIVQMIFTGESTTDDDDIDRFFDSLALN